LIGFNSNFIGYQPNTRLMFSGSDDKQQYQQNLKKQPSNWYYRDIEISYDYNSLGQRSKNIEEIDLDNYLLFSGCSYVEGIGLELEKTFPYVVSNELGLAYYNLGLGGSGIDIMAYNLLTWLNTVGKLPKAVVILWTFEERFTTLSRPNEDGLRFNLPKASDGNAGRFLSLGKQIGYFKAKRNLNSRLVTQHYSKTKIIELDATDLHQYDLARDSLHPGIISNQILAKKILDKLR
jgi:hypothetical protein